MAKLRLNFRPCKKIANFAAMKIEEVTAQEYVSVFPHPTVVYNSVGFTALNETKVAQVHRLVITANKPLLGLTVGERCCTFSAPFSAPFSCFDFNREHGAGVMIEAASLLRDNFPGLRLTLPPCIYAPSMTSRTLLAFLAAGARLECMDWNYYLDLQADFESGMTSAARNKLRQALRLGLRLVRVDAPRAYEVIRRNRQLKGYDLAMSLEQVLATTSDAVKADFFVLCADNSDVAAAMVYHAAPQIAQLIYWGDDACPNAMNLLACEVFLYYKGKGFKMLDIGPSGGKGYPNVGLSDFKDSIGCLTIPKPTLAL